MTTSVVNVMLQMNNRIRGKVHSSLPPISDANESKTNFRNNSADNSLEQKEKRSIDPLKEVSRNGNRTGNLPKFSKQNTINDVTK